MRLLVLSLCALAALSCREIQPLSPGPPEIVGYRLEGSVTTATGVPVDSVEIRLWYNYSPAGTPPIDTSHVVVTDPTKVVDISVLTPGGQLVRQLFLSYRPVGPIPRMQWDFRDDHGKLVPAGKYLVRYAVDTVVMKIEKRIIQGTPTVFTDSHGDFAIGNDRLPVGEAFDIYTVVNSYAGTYVIIPRIDLEFRKAGLFNAASITLELNRLTTAPFTVQ